MSVSALASPSQPIVFFARKPREYQYRGAYPIANWQKTRLFQMPFCLWSDVDDTFIAWLGAGFKQHNDMVLQQTKRALKKLRPVLSSNAITGRGLGGVQRFAHLFKGVQLDSLAVNNGAAWFINFQHLPAPKWIRSLTYANQVPFWRRYVQSKTGWDVEKVCQAIQSVIEDNGYKAVPNTLPQEYTKDVHDREITVTTHGDETTFTIKGVPASNLNTAPDYGEIEEEIATDLQNQITERLGRMNLDWANKETLLHPGKKQVFTVSAKGLDKSQLVDVVSYFQPKLKGIFTAGDHPHNDHHIKQEYYRSNPFANAFPTRKIPKGHEALSAVPNYRIISEFENRADEWRTEWAEHPTTHFVPHGELGQPILDIIQGHLQQWAA